MGGTALDLSGPVKGFHLENDLDYASTHSPVRLAPVSSLRERDSEPVR